MMQRHFLSIAYKGVSYHGWQRQPTKQTIQGCIEEALKQIGQPVKIVGSSRTDARVNAHGQIAHFDLPASVHRKKLLHQLNAVLPNTIVIHAITPVKGSTHARYDAYSRTYEYHIIHNSDPFHSDTTYFLTQAIDVALMNKASQLLIGKQNFKSFCKKKSSVAHHFCQVSTAFWASANQRTTFHITANRFLHGMVRTIAGTLLEVGRHKISIEDFRQIIHAQDRTLAKTSLPPQALFLTNVCYPTDCYV